MESLGIVDKVTRDGAILVRAHAAARIGQRVVDNRHEEIGRVKELIGPVKNPYLVVEPRQNAKLHHIQGKELFVR